MESDQSAARTRSHGVVFVFFLAQSTTRWAQGCRPRSKQQVGFEKEDQDLVSALATAKNASCCRCAKHRADIRDPDRPLPNSRPLARSLCGHATRSRLADGEAGKIPCVEFYGARICGTSRSDRQMRCYPISARIPTIWCDMHGIPKNLQRGLVQPFIAAMQISALVLMLSRNELPSKILIDLAVSLP